MINTTLKEAIEVDAHLEVDWEKLGRVFADEYSNNQAKFLLGFYEQVEDLQLAFIGSEKEIPEHARADLADVLRRLASFISPDPVDAA